MTMQAIIKLKTFRLIDAPAPAPMVCEGRVTTPREAFRALQAIFDDLDAYQEHFAVLALNSKGKAIGYKVVSSGTQTSCLVDPGMVYRAALLLGAQSVVVAHNHPSGDSTPSSEDIALTKRLIQAGSLLGVQLADHVILGEVPRSMRVHNPELFQFA